MLKMFFAALIAFLVAGGRVFAQTGSITIALAANVNTLDPEMTATVGTDLSVLSHIYPALMLRGADLKLQPALATSWTAVNDTTWDFKLQPGAAFANGEELNADAVKWNLDRVRDPKVNARIKAWFDAISAVDIVSPTELRILTSAPYPTLPDQLSMFFLLPPQWSATHKPASETMSGGRYAISENVPGDHITLHANPGYWGEKPAIATVNFRIIPEAASRVAALEAGEVDLVTGIPPSELAHIKADGRAMAGAIPSTRTMFMKFNTELKPLDDRLFRQALNYAIDKDAIAQAIFSGTTRPSACQLLTSDYFGFNPDLRAYPFDPDKARALLKQAGVAPGTKLQMDVPVGVYLQGQDVAQAVASELGDIGLDVNITEMDFGAFMNKYLKARALAQTSLLTYAWPTLDAGGVLALTTSATNYGYYHNADYDSLVTQGLATADPVQRRAIYAKATKLYCDEAAALFLFPQPATYGTSKRVAWQARGDDWVRAWDMTLVR
jgi:peptide/nickel transport system substrate-binding protein